jgi:hypothetical protein
MIPPLIGGSFLYCPLCPRDRPKRVRTLTQYRRHFARHHAEILAAARRRTSTIIMGAGKLYATTPAGLKFLGETQPMIVRQYREGLHHGVPGGS